MITITEEMVAAFIAAANKAADNPEAGGPEWSVARGLEAVAEMIDAEQVAPIEQALAAAETDVARLGRALNACTAAYSRVVGK